MSEAPVPVSQDVQDIQAMTQLADAMSLSLLYSLGRQYLEVPFAEAAFLQPLASDGVPADPPHFLRLEQVGDPLGPLHQPFTALQTALAACHDPGQYSLLFVVVNDGITNRVYFGVRGQSAQAQPYAFVDYLGHFLEGNWPGTRLQRCGYEQEVEPRILYPISRRLRHAVALTGIPSLKPGDHPGYPQSLDRLLRGLRGKPFMYVVVAEPITQDEVHQTIDRCRDLIGQVHTLTKSNVTETLTRGLSKSWGRTDTYQESDAHQEGSSTGKSRQIGLNLGLGVLGMVIAPVFPPAAFLGALASAGEAVGVGALGGINFGVSRQKTQSVSDTHTVSRGINIAETAQVSMSAAQALGREYVNAYATAAEEQLTRYIARFEQARTMGCWNVGVYFLAEEVDTALQGGAQLRALLSGEKSAFEPIRTPDLARVWTSGLHSAQVALSELRQPALALVHPEGSPCKLMQVE
jgi:hypothetical protein